MLMGRFKDDGGYTNIYDTYVNCLWPYASDQNAVVKTLVIGEIERDAMQL